MLLSIEFARRFSLSSGGRIITLTSGQGVGAMPGKIPYIATTGWISADSELKRTLIDNAPFGRVGQPEDAARLIAFLASDAARWITGQIMRSRGGF